MSRASFFRLFLGVCLAGSSVFPAPGKGLGAAAADGAPAEIVEQAPSSAVTVREDWPVPSPRPGEPVRVYVIAVEGSIGQALLFAFRRGMKEAIRAEADVLLLDMNTPGGALDATLEMMRMLDRFDGITMTYVNDEAISAGAFIAAATQGIYFAPRGIIGSAAPVTISGQEIPESMRLKLMSYLEARIRSFTAEYPYRTEVIMAMADPNFALEIDGDVIKPAGRLLTLTADQAMQEYGDPPRPLLGSGIFGSMEELLDAKFGQGNYTLNRFEPTWSESVAIFLKAISPLLLALGMVALLFEFRTPGFGIPGIAGIVMLVLVFFGHHLAGLSGMEPLLLLALGIALIFAELLLFPGLIFPSVLGLLMVLVSIVWGMTDIWPGGAQELTPAMFVRPMANLMLSFLLAAIAMLLLWRVMPRSWFWDKLVLEGAILGNAQEATPGEVTGRGGSPQIQKPRVGARGTAVTDLYPSGQIEIDGRRYEARVEYGSASRGDVVEVAGYVDFGLLVRVKKR